MNYYRILGVSEQATHDEIRRAYQERAKLIHPDHRFGEPAEVLQRANEEMASLNEAWDTLKDDARRVEYDQDLLEAAWLAANLRRGGPDIKRDEGGGADTGKGGGKGGGTGGGADGGADGESRATSYRFEPDPDYPSRMRLPSECVACGSVPAAMATFRISDSSLIFRGVSRDWKRPYSPTGPFCHDCGIAVFRDTMNKTLCIGWFRPIPIFFNIVVIALNFVNSASVLKLGNPVRYPGVITFLMAPERKGRTLLLRVGVYWTLLLAGFFWLVWSIAGFPLSLFAVIMFWLLGATTREADRIWS